MQPLGWPHDTNLIRYEKYSVVTEKIVVHALRSFASQFTQGIISFMNSLGTEDGFRHVVSNFRLNLYACVRCLYMMECTLSNGPIEAKKQFASYDYTAINSSTAISTMNCFSIFHQKGGKVVHGTMLIGSSCPVEWIAVQTSIT